MDGNSIYVIAEAGVNHNSDVDLARKMVDVAKSAGADAVKFQTWRTAAENVSAQTPLTEYQKASLDDSDGGQLELLDSIGLSFDVFRELKAYCDDMGIDFISTPDDKASIDLLVELNVPYLKTASAETNNLPFLRMVAATGIPVILSTGMSTLGEVETALSTMYETGNREITVLHCTSEYPCPIDAVNLRAMVTLKQAFGIRVGYSDHTQGLEAPVAAAALGAQVIEKHFTMDRNMEGPDHDASLEPHELEDMVRKIRDVELLLGDGIKRVMPVEHGSRALMRRSLVAARDILAGETISVDDVLAKRPGTGIPPGLTDSVVGRQARQAIEEDTLITWADLE